MSVETAFLALAGPLCSGRVYPDLAPLDTTRPFVTFQQVGGEVINPLNGSTPNLKNSRLQVNVWADTRKSANELMRQIEDALRPTPFSGRPIGALIAIYDEVTKTRGSQQDFSIWWT